MKLLVTIASIGALTLLGCHKKEAVPSPPAPAPEAAVAPETAASAQPAAQPQAAPRPAVQAQAQPAKPLPPPPSYITANADNTPRATVAGTVDAAMTSQLRAFVNKKGRMPGSFFEFTAAGMDSVPRPPEGKKWVIDTGDVSVKAIPK